MEEDTLNQLVIMSVSEISCRKLSCGRATMPWTAILATVPWMVFPVPVPWTAMPVPVPWTVMPGNTHRTVVRIFEFLRDI